MTEQQLLTDPEANPQSEGQPAQPLTGSSEPTVDNGQQQVEAPKPQEGKDSTSEAEKAEPEKSEPEGAPERYEFETPEGLPEGHKLEPEFIATYSEAARELNLPQKSAQKLLNKVLPDIVRRGQEHQAKQSEAWAKETLAMPELNEGEGKEANLKLANETLAKFGDDGLHKLLTGPQGLGNHPALVRLLVKVGKATSADGFVGGDRAGGGPPTDDAAIAQKLFKNSSKQRG